MTVTNWSAAGLSGKDPGGYEPHPAHCAGRAYRETNCYADVLIELLHARGLEPLAVLGFIARTDWEGDQFTYFKPHPADLERLFAVDVHEMLPHRSVPEHIHEQLSHRRTVLVEIDAYYLPDTAGTSYRRDHLKTTIAPDLIDEGQERLRYFHNGGLWELDGEDYRGAFRQLPHFTEDVMLPFIEVVRFDAGERLSGAELHGAAQEMLTRHFRRRPPVNPLHTWSEQLPADMERLSGRDVKAFHEYAFVTVRMVGSAFELFADHVEWLLGAGGADAGGEFRAIAEQSMPVSFRIARRRPFDAAEALRPMIDAYERGMESLGRQLGEWS
ncbi:MAG: DUF1839 family protein [Solirubrobacteraceae bacterium]